MSESSPSVDALPEHVRNRRGGGGGLMQLVAHGAADPLAVWGNDPGPNIRYAYNTGASTMHWFVERADGLPLAPDLPTWVGGGILAHVPAAKAPSTAPDGSTVPFRVRSEACGIAGIRQSSSI
jgi:hypothetical protein